MLESGLTHLRGARVLLGAHDERSRGGLMRSLRAHGVDVAEARNADELVTVLVEQGPFDAVIGDISLPGPTYDDVIAMSRRAGLDLAFILFGPRPADPAEAPPDELAEGSVVIRLPRPIDLGSMLRELDHALASSAGGEKFIYAECAACGRRHIAELWPTDRSLCPRCGEQAIDNLYRELGDGD